MYQNQKIMTTTLNIAVIGNEISNETLKASVSEGNRFHLRKIFVTDNLATGIVRSQYPEAEIVNDVKAIVNDTAIDLVLISAQRANDLPAMGNILQAGKHVRVI